MSLISLAHAYIDPESGEKHAWEVTALMQFIESDGGYKTPWVMLSVYSALVDKFRSRKQRYKWINNKTYDTFGRVRKTELWR